MDEGKTNQSGRRNTSLVATLREHPGLLLTVLYLIASMIGLAFSWSLFSQFNINIFSYAEVTDFLMAALREPLTIPLTASAVLVAWALQAMARWEIRWFAKHSPRYKITRGYRTLSKKMYDSGWIGPFAFIAYAYLFLAMYGDWKSEQIKMGKGDFVEVYLASGDTPDRLGNGRTLLLGATNKYIFVYHLDTHSTDAVPNENIAWIKLTPERRVAGDDNASISKP